MSSVEAWLGRRKKIVSGGVRKNMLYAATETWHYQLQYVESRSYHTRLPILPHVFGVLPGGCRPHYGVFLSVGQTQECDAHVPNYHLSRLACAEHDLPLQLVALSDTQLLHRCDSPTVHT